MNQRDRFNSKLWILGGIIFIVMLTLFPFKFQAMAWSKKDAIKEFLRNPSDSFDFLAIFFSSVPSVIGYSSG